MATKVKVKENDEKGSGFKDTHEISGLGSHQTEKEPDFQQCLRKIIRRQSPKKRQERKYKVAVQLAKLVTELAYALDGKWKNYINANNKRGVKAAPLRTLSEDKYEAVVPLIRPMRLDGFRIIQKGIDELPAHRCMIQVNPALNKEEATLVHNEWDPFIDKKGFLKPAGILAWFNTGLSKACSVVLSENHNVDKLVCHVGADGTATLHATVTEFDGGELEMDEFSVNVFPVFIIDKLPSSLKLNAPLPCFGPFIHGQKKFRELVIEDIENGKEIVFLDPKTELTSTRSLARDGSSWKLNLSFTEYHVYSLIDRYCRGLNFRHVLILMSILREQCPLELGMINNEILVNTLFMVSQKHIHKIHKNEDWVFKLLQTLGDGLNCGFLPSFYLPRQNLLDIYGIDKDEQAIALRAVQVILKSIQQTPKSIYKFTGYVDKKTNQSGEHTDGCEPTSDDTENVDGTSDENQEDEMEMNEMLTGYGSVHESYVPVQRTREEESVITKLSKRGDRSDIY